MSMNKDIIWLIRGYQRKALFLKMPEKPFLSNRLRKELIKNNKEEFMSHYHLRSNAESGFFMLKQRFGDFLFLKDPTGQTNEILCKILCHNLCVLAQELYLSNIEINFKSCASMMVAH